MSFAVESLTATDAGAGVIVQECSLDMTVISETNETEQKKDQDCSSAHTKYQ